MGKRLQLNGKKFGKLTVVSFSHIDKKRRSYWNCWCLCGNSHIVRGSTLKEGLTVSCGCNRPNKLPKGQAHINYLYRNYKRHSETKNRKFRLTKTLFTKLIAKNCYYCGDAPKNKASRSCYNGDLIYNGIDRLNNNLGYSKENCVTCCKDCNFLKNTRNHDEFINIIFKIYKHVKVKNEQSN